MLIQLWFDLLCWVTVTLLERRGWWCYNRLQSSEALIQFQRYLPFCRGSTYLFIYKCLKLIANEVLIFHAKINFVTQNEFILSCIFIWRRSEGGAGRACVQSTHDDDWDVKKEMSFLYKFWTFEKFWSKIVLNVRQVLGWKSRPLSFLTSTVFTHHPPSAVWQRPGLLPTFLWQSSPW